MPCTDADGASGRSQTGRDRAYEAQCLFQRWRVEPARGFEPRTYSLPRNCTASVLCGQSGGRPRIRTESVLILNQMGVPISLVARLVGVRHAHSHDTLPIRSPSLITPSMERARGIEPRSRAWEARTLPLCDARNWCPMTESNDPLPGTSWGSPMRANRALLAAERRIERLTFQIQSLAAGPSSYSAINTPGSDTVCAVQGRLWYAGLLGAGPGIAPGSQWL